MERWKVIAADKKAEVTIREENKKYKGVRYLLQGFDDCSGTDARYACFNWREQFISTERLANLGVIPCPGDVIKLYFDRYGAIDEIIVESHDSAYPSPSQPKEVK